MQTEDLKNNEKVIQIKNLVLILLITIDLIFIVSISIFNLPKNDMEFMAYFDLLVCLILFINLVDEFRHRDCSTTDFLKTHIIDIISIIPFNFIFLRYLTLFRAFRIIQFLQVIRVINIRKVNPHSFKFFVQNQLLRALTIMLVLYMVLSSIILYTIDESFLSIFDSFWYNLVTITGVGYGDITPVTSAGKTIGMLTIIIGVLFISVFTAAMSALYMEKPEKETKESVEKYLKYTMQENKELKEEINSIKTETQRLNKKIDELREMLNEKN